MKSILVCGAGGFIGGHLVNRLKDEGNWVRGVDIKYHEYSESKADDFVKGDLRDPQLVKKVIDRPFDEIYQLAADMGGAGFIFSGCGWQLSYRFQYYYLELQPEERAAASCGPDWARQYVWEVCCIKKAFHVYASSSCVRERYRYCFDQKLLE